MNVVDGNAVSPRNLAVNPITNKTYVADFDSSNLTVIDGATRTIAATLPLDARDGHVSVGDYTVFGGNAAVRQRVRIGEGAMIVGLAGVRADVIPFGLVVGAVGQLAGLNMVGMKRRKFSRDSIYAARRAYRMLFFGEGSFADRIDRVDAELGTDDAVAAMVGFLREDRGRPLCHPGRYRD